MNKKTNSATLGCVDINKKTYTAPSISITMLGGNACIMAGSIRVPVTPNDSGDPSTAESRWHNRLWEDDEDDWWE